MTRATQFIVIIKEYCKGLLGWQLIINLYTLSTVQSCSAGEQYFYSVHWIIL